MSFVDEQYALVPRWLLESDISDGAIRLYAILSARYVDGGSGGECWPGIPTMAKFLSCSEAKVSRILNELADKKAITRHRRLGTSTVTVINRLNPARTESLINERTESRTDESLTRPSNNQTKLETKEETSPSEPTELERDFKEFYGAFPLRRKPKEAFAKYRAARKEATHAEIMAGIGPYIKDVERQRAEGFAQLKWQAPSSWLYQGRWRDEYDVPQTDTDGRRRIEKARRILSAEERAAKKIHRHFPYDNDSARIMGESTEVDNDSSKTPNPTS